MEDKKVMEGLVSQGYELINDLNKVSFMSAKEKLLIKNGQKTQLKGRELVANLHNMVDAFGEHIETMIKDCVKEKSEILESLSEEILQCVGSISHLCMMSENLLKENSTNLMTTFGPQLKEEFVKCLKEYKDLKFLDYDTFTSLDLEVDIKGILKPTIATITNRNPRSMQRQIIYELSFGDLKGSEYASRKFEMESEINSGGSELAASASTQMQETSSDQGSRADTKHLLEGAAFTKRVQFKDLQQDVSGPKTSSKQIKVRPCYMDQPEETAPVKQKTGRTRADLLAWKKLDLDLKSATEKKTHQKHQPDRGLETNVTSLESPTAVELEDEEMPILERSNSNSSDLQVPLVESDNPESDTVFWGTTKQIKSSLLSLDKVRDNVGKAEDNESDSKLVIKKQAEESFFDEWEAVAAAVKEYEETESAEAHHQHMAAETSQFTVQVTDDMKTLVKEELISPSELDGPAFQLQDPEPLPMNFSVKSVLSTGPGGREIYGEHLRTIRAASGFNFDHPTGLTVRPDGLLVVTDTGTNKVKILKGDELVLSIGDKDGIRLKRPSAVVCDTYNNIYVKDDFCIQAFDANGGHFKTIGFKLFSHPFGLSFVKSGQKSYLSVVDHDYHTPRIYNYSLSEDKLTSFDYQPLLNHGGPNSKVRFIASYKNQTLASDLGASTMYLSTLDGHDIKCFGRFGNYAGAFWEPSGVTVDTEGNWLIGDSKNNRVQVYTSDGYFLSSIRFSEPIRRPSGIHLTNEGQLYVINYLDSIVKVFQLKR